MEDQKEKALERLKILYQNLDTGMTAEKYFSMMEQLEKEPIESEIPPEWDDLPDIVIQAINTWNHLGDRAYPEIGYTGKDFTNLPYWIELYEIEDMEFFLILLHWLDDRAIKKSSEQLKKEYEKLKRQNRGR